MNQILEFLATGLLALPWWGVAVAALVMIFFTTLATTLYLHRDQCHRGVDLHPAVAHPFRLWLWMSTGINTKEWVAVHRKHHARCETEEDPHSPQVLGLKKVLLEGAELYQAEARNAGTLEKFGRGTPTDWIERKLYSRFGWLGIALLFVVNVALFGVVGIAVGAAQMAAMPVMSAGVINGIGHYWGYRNFECKDAATNIMPWGIWFGGEELHNNHHAFPSSAKFALRRGEFDIGWSVIRTLERFGLAKVRRVAPVPTQVDREHLDLEGVRSIISARLHVLRDYTRTVTMPTLSDEWHRFGDASRRLEEAKKRDHRKLGRELELFTFSEKVGQGLPLWLPKGTLLRERLVNFMKKAQDKSGYQQVVTPHIGHKALYETSGHYEKYGKDSFQPIATPHEGEEFLLKPMNCPHHCEIYKHKPRSYKDLPIRYAEFGTVYRYEQSGELHGLTRVRGFTQDDAHIFCRPDQVKEEFIKVIDLVLYVFRALGFENYTAQISLRDPENKEKYIGEDSLWDRAESDIIEAAKEKGLDTVTELGEAAFYGPKLDFMVKDALGRSWQLGTIQVDYQLPNRFELEYVGSDNQRHRPVMIHRAPFGSMERFVAVLIEHCAGNFPLWLTPEQVAILPISEKYNEHTKNLLNLLNNYDIRGFVDERNEKIGKKIRDTEVKKIPYMLIIGEKEVEQELLSVRKHGEGDLGSFTIEKFKELIDKEIESRLITFKI
jgi:threonyl-tRNA synthetase